MDALRPAFLNLPVIAFNVGLIYRSWNKEDFSKGGYYKYDGVVFW